MSYYSTTENEGMKLKRDTVLSDSSIKEAVVRYKHLALKWFPDLHDNSDASLEEFRNISEAIATLIYSDKPINRQMTLGEMFSLFQSIFFGDSSSFDDDDDSNKSYNNDDLYDSELEGFVGGSIMSTEETNSLALQNAQELILEEEREKKKAEKRKARKQRRKERKRKEKASEENVQQKSAANFSECEADTAKESSLSASEEDIDTASTFVAVIAKKKKHIPICEPKQKDEPQKETSTAEKILQDTSRVLRSRQLAIRGNEMANLGQFSLASDLFSESIKLDPSDHRFYGNRSYCYDRLCQFERALKDAEKSIALCPKWAKGYYRKGRAFLGLKNYAQSEESFVKVLQLDSDCDDAVKELQTVKVLQLTEMGFSPRQAEAAVEEHGSVQEALNALMGSSACAKDQGDLFLSDDDSDNLFSAKSTDQPYDSKMDPTNPEGHCSIWIGNVQPDVTEKMLTSMFDKFGGVVSVRILADKFCAFVNFRSQISAGKAMETCQGQKLSSARLVIRFPALPGELAAASRVKPKDECHFWRTTGCSFGASCRYRHVREHKAIDRKGA